MSNDPTEPSVSSDADSSDDVVPKNTNYGRWMTNLAGINDMRLGQLAIPGAHNSGVDMAGTWGIEELLAACQNNSFHHQLNVGARYLDLRLEDRSEGKLVGNFAPQWVWVESFVFTHGNDSSMWSNTSAGRTIQSLVDIARIFSTENPGEFLILDIRKFKKKYGDSLDKAFKHLTPIKHLLIPNSASDMLIGEIRQKHPGRNIILSFDHGTPKEWKWEWVQKDHLWPTMRHEWSSDDSPENIEKLINNLMDSPPTYKYWVLSAACRNANGAMHLRSDHPVRTAPFKPGKQNVNVLMVDFIERAETIASVTDACIALNRRRIANLASPSPPSNLSARQLDGEGLQNTVEFKWTCGADNVGIAMYEIYEGDNLLITTSSMPHREKNLYRKNYILKVRAVSVGGRPSAFSSPFTLIQDTTCPTIPPNLRVGFMLSSSIHVRWDSSYDEAGVAAYEVIVDGYSSHTVSGTSLMVWGLEAKKRYTLKVRAVDINGFYSEYADLEFETYPKELSNPRLDIIEAVPGASTFTAAISWDPPTRLSSEVICRYKLNGAMIPVLGISNGEERPSLKFEGGFGELTSIDVQIYIGDDGWSDVAAINFALDASPLPPVTDLKLTSNTSDFISISWSPSASARVVGYVISVHDDLSILVPSTQTTYQFIKPPTDEGYLVEVWAVGNFTLPSVAATLDITPPSRPGIPTITQETGRSVTILWTPSTDSGGVTSYEVTLDNNSPLIVPSNTHTFSGLNNETSYSVVVRAKDASGNFSEPSSVSFIKRDATPPSRPGTPIITNSTGSSVIVDWAASVDDSDILRYEITLDDSPPLFAQSNMHTFSGLKLGTSYTVRIRAMDTARNFSEPSSVSFITKDVTPPSQPGSFSISNITSDAAQVFWYASTGGGVDYYEVTLAGRQPFYIRENRYTFAGLNGGSLYNISVRAQDAAGNTSRPSLGSFTTKPSIPPGKPYALSLSNITPTTATLNWMPADGLNVTYKVWLNDSVVADNWGQQHYSAISLQSGKEHSFQVAARNEAGTSESVSVTFETLPVDTRPAGPTNFRYTQPSDTTILEWDAPNEPVIGYRVKFIDPAGKELNYLPTTPTMSERLPARTRFEVRITARGAAGESIPLIAELTTK
jgi:chitodextrinase